MPNNPILHDFKAVFFDLDDTLYDQNAPFINAISHSDIDIKDISIQTLFNKVRFYSDELWPKHIKGELSLESLRIKRLVLAFREFGIPITENLAQIVQEYYLNEQGAIKPFPAVYSLISYLQEQNVMVGIITNGPVHHQKMKLRQLQIDKLIPEEHWFVSDGVGIAKPDKRIFEYVNQTIGIQSEHCCYIGDNWENDVMAAIDAGWTSIWINNRKKEPLSNHKPYHTISNLEELL
jgi:putative hydrolase of the HAD superfamily